jgi:multiple sugar transport system substrate-binding protein
VKLRVVAAGAAAVLVGTLLAGCGGGGSGGKSSGTLTYWASNQAPSLEADRKVLTPELDRFTKQTGVKVKLQVISWADLLNRILGATTSGKGPDVVNIGNTWAASLQATGAFVPFDSGTLTRVGGKGHFLATSLASCGAPGKPPGSVPVYGLAYGLFYNKKLFTAAGIDKPPATWAEMIDDAKKLTKPGQWGLAVEGASYTENAHFAFMFGKQNGASVFDGTTPKLDSPQMVAGVRQYLDLMQVDKVVNPANAEYANDTPFIRDFATGKAAMLMVQSFATSSIQQDGMSADDFAVAPIPLPNPLPAGGKKVNSHVAGINMAVFKNTKNRDAALKFVKFMTSTSEQKALNAKFGTLPVVPDAYADPRFQTPSTKVFQQVLATTSQPLPMIPQEAQFETLVGNAVKALWADIAAGKTVGDSQIKDALTSANQQMKTGG